MILPQNCHYERSEVIFIYNKPQPKEGLLRPPVINSNYMALQANEGDEAIYFPTSCTTSSPSQET